MDIVVQKFGGTSVSSENNRILVTKKIKKAIKDGYKPVVVVSAMGRKGSPYATDTLLSLVSEEFKINNPRALDLLLSCGETLSTVVMCNDLLREGVEAVPLMGGEAGIRTDNNFNNASILDVNPKNVLKVLEQGKVPVVAGFQGISEEGSITTIGRGGSDVTGAILGAALKAKEVQIYTDVDGIMTADPRIVSKASLIESISYDEVFQFADQGAKVIHPRAVEISRKYNIPLVIKNTLSDCEGTTISSYGEDIERIITGITHMSNRVQIRINGGSKEHCNNIFHILAENEISIDLISVFINDKIFTISEVDLDKFKNIAANYEIDYKYTENCSKISIIGSKMRGIPGVMSRILKALEEGNIDILQTADSHTTIWCLVESNKVKDAINLLHNEFKLG
ncbi:aspartate kinase [Clostridium sulfidigenes]|uniref:Aspartokinase n=2 Tax=Clostridium sulfidigenes TaxID=318464 RepID=A0A084JBT3_9CLOT|nr:aspartate kinase [Clostridium sulfidigenes]KEZ86417.1 aspartate kinase [Clostridium sulfidigenes]